MPNAVLASVVFLIGLRLDRLTGMRDILRLRPASSWSRLITAATVVVVGVEQGIILAMALSIDRAHLPQLPAVRPPAVARRRRARRVDPVEAAAPQAAPGLAIYRFGASLYYANASRFTEEIMDLVEAGAAAAAWLVSRGSAIGDVDYSGADAIRAVARGAPGARA